MVQPAANVGLAVATGAVWAFIFLLTTNSATRWQVYVLSALIAAVALLAGDLRRLLVTFFVIGLSLNVHYYLTPPERVMFLGNSSPVAFSIPLVLLPGLSLGLWMVSRLRREGVPFRWGGDVGRRALLVLATVVLSTLTSSVRLYGFYSIAEILQWLLIFLVAVNLVHSERDFQFIQSLLLATLGIQSAVFLAQMVSGAAFSLTGQIVSSATESGTLRPSGTVGAVPSGYATFLEPLVFLALTLWRASERPGLRRVSGVLGGIGLLTVVATLNRSSWVALAFGLFTIEVLCRRRHLARPIPVSAVLGFVGLGAIAVTGFLPAVVERMGADHEADWRNRYDLIRIAANMIAANPVLGVGPGAYPFRMREYLPPGVGWIWVVHNDFLLVWAERGLLGLMAYVLWLRAGLREALRASLSQSREYRAFGVACVAGVVAFVWELMLNSYEPFSCYALVWFLFGVLVSGNLVYAGQPDSPRTGAPTARVHGGMARRV